MDSLASLPGVGHVLLLPDGIRIHFPVLRASVCFSASASGATVLSSSGRAIGRCFFSRWALSPGWF
jgi:hypothetical protein